MSRHQWRRGDRAFYFRYAWHRLLSVWRFLSLVYTRVYGSVLVYAWMYLHMHTLLSYVYGIPVNDVLVKPHRDVCECCATRQPLHSTWIVMRNVIIAISACWHMKCWTKLVAHSISLSLSRSWRRSLPYSLLDFSVVHALMLWSDCGAMCNARLIRVGDFNSHRHTQTHITWDAFL